MISRSESSSLLYSDSLLLAKSSLPVLLPNRSSVAGLCDPELVRLPEKPSISCLKSSVLGIAVDVVVSDIFMG